MIRRMVRDLDFPVEIEVLPTVREADGLAMSSRNAYLEPRGAPARGRPDPRAARRRAMPPSRARRGPSRRSTPPARSCSGPGVEPEYLEARDAESLAPAKSLNGRPVLVAVAARFGRARLIDNLVIGG